MRTLITFVLTLLAFYSCTAQEPLIEPVDPNGAKIKFEKDTVYYGNVPWHSAPEREFKFTNTGKEPLVIFSAQGSCGCLVLKWPREPISPGTSGKIIAHYDTGRVGPFVKSFVVTSNAVNAFSKTLTIRGKVLPLTAKDSLEAGYTAPK
jgi:hypothetical protein